MLIYFQYEKYIYYSLGYGLCTFYRSWLILQIYKQYWQNTWNFTRLGSLGASRFLSRARVTMNFEPEKNNNSYSWSGKFINFYFLMFYTYRHPWSWQKPPPRSVVALWKSVILKENNLLWLNIKCLYIHYTMSKNISKKISFNISFKKF